MFHVHIIFGCENNRNRQPCKSEIKRCSARMERAWARNHLCRTSSRTFSIMSKQSEVQNVFARSSLHVQFVFLLLILMCVFAMDDTGGPEPEIVHELCYSETSEVLDYYNFHG